MNIHIKTKELKMTHNNMQKYLIIILFIWFWNKFLQTTRLTSLNKSEQKYLEEEFDITLQI